MNSSFFFTAIDYELGNLKEILSNNQILPSMRVFAALSLSEPDTIIKYSLELIKSSNTSDQCRTRISILLAVMYLSIKQRNNSVNLLNELGTPQKNKITGWLEDYFYSTWNLLINYLKDVPLHYKEDIIFHRNIRIIGDSHTLGMMPALANEKKYYFNYIPGLRYSLLASPQSNLKQVAIKNALLFAYDSDCLIFSIGEIDMRSYLNELKNDIRTTKSLKYFEKIFSEGINFIIELVAHHQEVKIIIPPPPVHDISNFLEEKCIKEKYDEVINTLRKILMDKNIAFLDYPEIIRLENGFSSKEYMVDHAHFMEKIYMLLLGFKENKINNTNK